METVHDNKCKTIEDNDNNKDNKKIKKSEETVHSTLREKCPNTEFFWSEFSRIGTEHRDFKYGKIESIKLVFGHFLHSARARLKKANTDVVFVKTTLQHPCDTFRHRTKVTEAGK